MSDNGEMAFYIGRESRDKEVAQLQAIVAELETENERLSALCDKWNTECDEYREDNKQCSNELAALTRQRDHLKQQAECHAMEARTANSTLNEIYQLVSGATGEKANWNGAQPVREKLESLTRQRDQAVEALHWLMDTATGSDLQHIQKTLSTIKESEGK